MLADLAKIRDSLQIGATAAIPGTATAASTGKAENARAGSPIGQRRDRERRRRRGPVPSSQPTVTRHAYCRSVSCSGAS